MLQTEAYRTIINYDCKTFIVQVTECIKTSSKDQQIGALSYWPNLTLKLGCPTGSRRDPYAAFNKGMLLKMLGQTYFLKIKLGRPEVERLLFLKTW
jgi:hypothetical protein